MNTCNCTCDDCINKLVHCGIGFFDQQRQESGKCDYIPGTQVRKFVVVYADGGCKLNGSERPETYASFCVEGELDMHQVGKCGNTNNESEYAALIAALEYCVTKGLRPKVRMDSALVVNQCLGKWKVSEDRLRPLWYRARALLKEVNGEISWIAGTEMKKILGH